MAYAIPTMGVSGHLDDQQQAAGHVDDGTTCPEEDLETHASAAGALEGGIEECEPAEDHVSGGADDGGDEGDDAAGQGEEVEGAQGEDAQGEDEEDAQDEAENHGQVVRAAAHCPVRGREHGRLVSSIARQKEATVADAEAACAAAVAEAPEDAGEHREKHAKTDRSQRGAKKGDQLSSQDDAERPGRAYGGPPAHAGSKKPEHKNKHK